MKQLFLIAFFTVFAVNLTHSQELLWAVNTDTLGYQWAEAILIGEGNQAYVGGTGLEEMYLLHYDNHGNIEFFIQVLPAYNRRKPESRSTCRQRGCA